MLIPPCLTLADLFMFYNFGEEKNKIMVVVCSDMKFITSSCRYYATVIVGAWSITYIRIIHKYIFIW